MKTSRLLLVLLMSTTLTQLDARRRVLDKILVRVNGRNLLLSDLNMPRIEKDGDPYAMQELIDNEILFQQAAKRKLLATNLDVEKYVSAWKEASGMAHLTEEEFEKRLQNDGLSGKQYRGQLAQVLAVRNLRQLEVSERVVITSSEVETYHKKNTEYTDVRYQVKTRTIPFERAKTGEEAAKVTGIKWLTLDPIDESKLTDEMKFVASLNVGEMSKPIKTEHGHLFVTLVKREEKRLKTLEERWVSIEKELQKQKMEEFERDHLAQLREKASVVHLD